MWGGLRACSGRALLSPLPAGTPGASIKTTQMAPWHLILFGLGKGAAIWLWWVYGNAWPGWVAFFGADVPLLVAMFVPSSSGLVRVFTRFETPRREVWLTIDDGPDPEDTPRILAVLAQHRAKATFFLIGERASKYPECVAAIRREGHEIAHHTNTHPDASFWCASPARLARELDQGLNALLPARPRAFRPPVGIKNLFLSRALTRRQLVYVGWSIRSWDSTARTAQDVVDHVLPRAHAGAIILLHEGPRLKPEIRVTAIAETVKHLAGQGFTCVLPETHQLR